MSCALRPSLKLETLEDKLHLEAESKVGYDVIWMRYAMRPCLKWV